MDHEDTNNEPTIFMGDGCDRVVSPELIYASEAPRSMTIWGEVEVGGGELVETKNVEMAINESHARRKTQETYKQ